MFRGPMIVSCGIATDHAARMNTASRVPTDRLQPAKASRPCRSQRAGLEVCGAEAATHIIYAWCNEAIFIPTAGDADAGANRGARDLCRRTGSSVGGPARGLMP